MALQVTDLKGGTEGVHWTTHIILNAPEINFPIWTAQTCIWHNSKRYCQETFHATEHRDGNSQEHILAVQEAHNLLFM